MAVINTNISCDLQSAVQVQYINGNMFSQDIQANTINVSVTDGGEPATISGTVTANIVRADGGTVTATGGTISGNVASITLPAAAYAVPGLVSIIVKLTDSGVVTTLAAVVANVYQSSTETAVDPGTIIPSVTALVSQIETAVASIPADYSSLWTSLAPAFSASASYAPGQYVTYDGALYVCTTAHTGSWVAGHFAATNLGAGLSDLKSAFDDFSSEVLNIEKINKIRYADKASTSVNGLTYSITDGVMAISGTTTASTTIEIPLTEDIPAGSYYFNNFITYADVSGITGTISLKTHGGQYITLAANTDINKAVTVESDAPVSVYIYIGNNKTLNNTYHFCLTTSALPGVDRTDLIYPEDEASLAPTMQSLCDERYGENYIQSTRVVCWGDSLTDGTGSSSINTDSYPVQLQGLITEGGNNLEVLNAGIGGEDSFSVSVRQGGTVVQIAPATIPASGGVAVDNIAWNGRDITLLKRGGTNVTYNISKLRLNPSSIAGVSGDLLRTSEGVLTFTRATSGSAVTFDRPVDLVVDAVEHYNLPSDITIIWVGTNNVNDNISVVINCINTMIAALKNDKYIVIGLTAKVLFSDIAERNFAMANVYGTHFLNIRDYMLAYGLQDAGITPTAQDTADIANGEIPSSLRYDTVHLTTAGYTIVANQVYKKGKELGYWE